MVTIRWNMMEYFYVMQFLCPFFFSFCLVYDIIAISVQYLLRNRKKKYNFAAIVGLSTSFICVGNRHSYKANEWRN